MDSPTTGTTSQSSASSPATARPTIPTSPSTASSTACSTTAATSPSTSTASPYNAAVYILTLLTSVIIIGAALFPPGRRAAGTAVDLSLAALSFTIASPVAWEHHYGILAPIYAATAPAMLARRIFGVWTAPWLAASYLLTSNYIHAAREAADTPFTPVQSYLFAGALMLLIALYRLRSVEAAHPAPEIASAGSAHETPAARTALGEA